MRAVAPALLALFLMTGATTMAYCSTVACHATGEASPASPGPFACGHGSCGSPHAPFVALAALVGITLTLRRPPPQGGLLGLGSLGEPSLLASSGLFRPPRAAF